jgi:hypothetical protein
VTLSETGKVLVGDECTTSADTELCVCSVRRKAVSLMGEARRGQCTACVGATFMDEELLTSGTAAKSCKPC